MANLLKEVSSSLPLIEQAKNKCLPDKLSIKCIATLWSNNNKSVTYAYTQLISKHIANGNIKTHDKPSLTLNNTLYAVEPSNHHVVYMHEDVSKYIDKNTFKSFLVTQGDWPINEGILLANWWMRDTETTQLNAWDRAKKDLFKPSAFDKAITPPLMPEYTPPPFLNHHQPKAEKQNNPQFLVMPIPITSVEKEAADRMAVKFLGMQIKKKKRETTSNRATNTELEQDNYQGKPSCGPYIIHKIIDKAFYSIKKSTHEIDATNVMGLLTKEIDDLTNKRLIDEGHNIKQIIKRNTAPIIEWTTKKHKIATLGYEQFTDLVNKLKIMNTQGS